MMRIGSVAHKLRLTPDAIRFYERRALLPHPPRTPGGYRLYSPGDLDTLAFIRRLQSLGFALSEIRGFLRLRAAASQPCAPVQRRLVQKLSDVRSKLADLRRIERELLLALEACHRGGRRKPAPCPLLRDCLHSR